MYKDGNLGFHITELYKKALEIIPFDKQVELSVETAEIFLSIGEIRKAEETVQKIVSSSDFPKLPANLRYTVFNKLFKIYYKSGNYIKAEDTLKELLEISNDLKDENLLCNIYVKFGNVYARKRDFEKAKEFYTKAVEIGEQTDGARRCLASAYNNIAVYYILVNKDSDRALIYFQKALSLYETESNNLSITARIILNLGNLFKTKGYYEKAQDYYQRAHSIAIKHHLLDILANVYHEKSEIFFAIEEYELSEIFIKKALELHKALNGREGDYRAGQAFELLAKIEEKKGGSIERIREYVHEAIGYYTKSESWGDAIKLYDFLGDVAYQRGVYSISKESYENGLIFAQKYGIEDYKQKLQDKLRLL